MRKLIHLQCTGCGNWYKRPPDEPSNFVCWNCLNPTLAPGTTRWVKGELDVLTSSGEWKRKKVAILEEFLGRKLVKGKESVQFRNGDVEDFSLFNLILVNHERKELARIYGNDTLNRVEEVLGSQITDEKFLIRGTEVVLWKDLGECSNCKKEKYVEFSKIAKKWLCSECF